MRVGGFVFDRFFLCIFALLCFSTEIPGYAIEASITGRCFACR
jgi:hypothetical protein